MKSLNQLEVIYLCLHKIKKMRNNKQLNKISNTSGSENHSPERELNFNNLNDLNLVQKDDKQNLFSPEKILDRFETIDTQNAAANDECLEIYSVDLFDIKNNYPPAPLENKEFKDLKAKYELEIAILKQK